ncbi:MAG: hypothetical protein QW499_03215 [Desulfurococcaceae archaeon]
MVLSASSYAFVPNAVALLVSLVPCIKLAIKLASNTTSSIITTAAFTSIVPRLQVTTLLYSSYAPIGVPVASRYVGLTPFSSLSLTSTFSAIQFPVFVTIIV